MEPTKKHKPSNSELGPVRGKGAGRERTDRVSLGLALLQRRCQPGVPLTTFDISCWAGCSENAIFLIEKRAIAKLRRRLENDTDPVLRELVEEYLYRRTNLEEYCSWTY